MNYAIAKIKSPDRTDSLATAILGFKCPAGLFGNRRKKDGFETLPPKCGVIQTIFY